MKKLLNLLLAILAIFGVACAPDNGDNNNGGGDAPQMTFTIDITDVTMGGATVNVTPSSDATYFFDIAEKAKVDSFATPLEYAADNINDLKMLIELFGIPLSEFLSTGNDGAILESLNPDTEYYAYAFGLTAEGEITSEVCLKEFKTLPDTSGPSNTTFVLDILNIWVDGATVSITPSNKNTYYANIVERSVYDQYESDEAFMNAKIAEVKAAKEAQGSTFAKALVSGNTKYSYAGLLTPGTEYYIYAFGASKEGVATTESVTKVLFKTLTPEEAAAGINNGDKKIEGLVRGRYVNYGDYYEVGATNWTMVLYNESGTSSLSIELQTERSATDLPVGEYPITSSLAAGTAIAGNLDEEYRTYGTIWTLWSNDWSTEVESVYFKSGTVTVGKSGDNFSISVDGIDGHGNTITASYSGTLEFVDFSTNAKELNARHNLVLRQTTPANFAPKRVYRSAAGVGKKVEQILSTK